MKHSYTKLLSLLLAASCAISGILPAFATETAEAADTTVSVGDTAPDIPPETAAADTTASAEEGTADVPSDSAEPAEAPYIYEIAGIGEILSAAAEPLGTAGTLYRYTAKNGSLQQSVFAAVIDPARGGIVRGVPLTDRLGGRAAVSALAGREVPADEALLLAVNADFFSFNTGVPMGVYVADGRFVSSSDGHAAIGFDKDGEAFIGTVGDRITIEHSGDTLPVSYLNKYPTVYGAYLLTRDFGETTYLSAGVPATEYIIELGGEITFDKRVRGKITEVRTGVSNGEIPEDCAVLVVPDAYENRALYADLDKGDRVYVEAEADKRFADAVNAIGGGDILLIDGEIAENLDKEDLQTARHPRTAAGITANGEILLVAADGRQSGYANGLKMTELAQMLRDMGCVSAINFDGGGSTVMVRFGETATLLNKPSDKAERKVPNALAAYMDLRDAEDFHILTATAEHGLMLSGSTQPLQLTLTDSAGEILEFTPDPEKTAVLVDERFGSAEVADGEVRFTAGDADGYGHIRIETEYDGEALFADVYLQVTSSIDTLAADQTLLLAPTDGEMQLRVHAEKDGKRVYFGDLVGVRCENENFTATVTGDTISITLPRTESAVNGAPDVPSETAEVPAATEPVGDGAPDVPSETAEVPAATESVGDGTPDVPPETAEATDATKPEPVQPQHGRVAVWLLDQTLVLPAYFDDAPALDLTAWLTDRLYASDAALTVTYDEAAGVRGDGAFRVELPVIETTEVPVTTEPTGDGAPDVPPETTEVPVTTEPVGDGAPDVPPETTEVPATTEPVGDGAPDVPPETTEVSVTTEPVGDSAPDVPPETTEVPATTEPEPVPEPFTVTVHSDAILSRGLGGHRLWMWADGLCADAMPYALFTVTDREGNTVETAVYYELYYDFLSFNGRALLTLTVPEADGVIALTAPLVYAAYTAEREVTFGPLLLCEEYDTNLYADTQEHWSSYFVNALSYMGVVGGSEDLTGRLVYRPDDGLSREQFAKILVGYLGIDTADYADTPLEFADNDAIAAWAVPYVQAAVGAGLMRGRSTPQDTVIFAPADGITRQEAFYVLGGLLTEVSGEELRFADSDRIAPWAAENLAKFIAAGLLSGYDDGTIRPEGRITRAEAATVVVRLSDFMRGIS